MVIFVKDLEMILCKSTYRGAYELLLTTKVSAFLPLKATMGDGGVSILSPTFSREL